MTKDHVFGQFVYLTKGVEIFYRNDFEFIVIDSGQRYCYILSIPTIQKSFEIDKNANEHFYRFRMISKLDSIKFLQIPARLATDDELRLNHPDELLRELEALKTVEECEDFCKFAF